MTMAVGRWAVRNLRQRLSSPSSSSAFHYARVQSNSPWGLTDPTVQRFFSSSTSGGSDGGKEVVPVQKKLGRRGWRSLLPSWRNNRRGRGLFNWRRDNDSFEISPTRFFPSNVGNALLEAAENMNRLFANITPGPTQIIDAAPQLMGRFKETEDSYKLRFEVPGLTKEDLKVTVDDGMLKIRGERKVEDEDEDEDEYWMSYGYYNTSLMLPDNARKDDIKAELKDGVLNITIPKVESQGKDVKEVKIH